MENEFRFTDEKGLRWTFTLGKSEAGGDILIASWDNGTESDSIWTTDLLSLPHTGEEAQGYLNDLDWAVGQSDAVR
jgi:hypothetical protein